MKILSLVDSFKGSLSSLEIKHILESAAQKYNHDLRAIPMSDGGEGFLNTISYILNKKVKYQTIFTFNKKVEMPYLINEDKVYLEVAAIVGMNLLKQEDLNPYNYKTTAIGDVIKQFYNKGYKNFVIGLGGTATNDFGIGLVESLGAVFYDTKGNPNNEIEIKELKKLSKIDLEPLKNYRDINIDLITDITNVSFGRNGATKTFAKQKGLNKKDFNKFEKSLKIYVKKLINAGALNSRNKKGSGAAGGLGFVFLSLFNSNIYVGAKYILKMLRFDEVNNDYNLVLTGEGKVDKQSLKGKVVFEVLKQSKTQTIIVCGINELNEKKLKKQYYQLINILAIVPNIATIEQSINDVKHFKVLIDNLFKYLTKD